MRAASAGVVAALATYLLTPAAIKLALRTAFVDHPVGYKGHKRATPYLGGCAIVAGILVGGELGGIPSRYALVMAFAVAVWVIGTADDRLNLPISLRLGVEIAFGVALAAAGLGWDVFHQGIADGVLSVLWVVGVMNAFNLMDNMDGASATVAAASSLGAGAFAIFADRSDLAPMCFATAGACLGFLPRNLSNPARIFMGDGGSLPLGLLVAAETMSAVNRNYLGPSGVVVGALLVGLVILDTTLVTVSRSRAGRPVLSGGRDHLTHRLVSRLGTPRRVALTLAAAQFAVCSVTIAVARAGSGWVLLTGGFAVLVGGVLIWQFESSPLMNRDPDEAAGGVAGAESDSAVASAPTLALQ